MPQIAYWELQEKKRHNYEQEEVSSHLATTERYKADIQFMNTVLKAAETGAKVGAMI